MISMVNPTHGDIFLEPCGGDGMFIDALLEHSPKIHIDTCDLDLSAVEIMRSKYAGLPNVAVRTADTLTDKLFDEYSNHGYYDKIIGNPPYGGWQEHERRSDLKRKFKGFYVKETYTLFLLRCISLLKEKGVLSFIIPDTFLFLHNHKKLRQFLLNNTIIREIVVFPSKFFPGVSFGYSNLSIITLEKETFGNKKEKNVFPVIKGLKSDNDLFDLSVGQKKALGSALELPQRDILHNPEYAFLIGDKRTNQSIVSSETKLADIADCVTGIYCGNNKEFLALANGNHRKIQNYPEIDIDNIDFEHKSIAPLGTSKEYITIVKGSSSTSYYRTSDKWLIKWSESALHHYNNDKKARFQNSRYYFRDGIALPMVKSTKIKASLMRGEVFDQSIVGVFPHEEKYLLYLLAYLNSDTANKYIHTINPTANNSANYLKKLPVYLPTESEMRMIDGLVMDILKSGNVEPYHKQINSFFENCIKKIKIVPSVNKCEQMNLATFF